MSASTVQATLSFAQRLEALRASKRAQTLEKQAVRGSMDYDDHGIVLPPEGTREVVHSLSGSGIAITDVIMTTFKPEANHPSGEFFGARACGENFRRLLEADGGRPGVGGKTLRLGQGDRLRPERAEALCAARDDRSAL